MVRNQWTILCKTLCFRTDENLLLEVYEASEKVYNTLKRCNTPPEYYLGYVPLMFRYGITPLRDPHEILRISGY